MGDEAGREGPRDDARQLREPAALVADRPVMGGVEGESIHGFEAPSSCPGCQPRRPWGNRRRPGPLTRLSRPSVGLKGCLRSGVLSTLPAAAAFSGGHHLCLRGPPCTPHSLSTHRALRPRPLAIGHPAGCSRCAAGLSPLSRLPSSNEGRYGPSSVVAAPSGRRPQSLNLCRSLGVAVASGLSRRTSTSGGLPPVLAPPGPPLEGGPVWGGACVLAASTGPGGPPLWCLQYRRL